jgi:phosphatidylserine/phosphatidylglycerophosphate/cardiolipin synthase-like enzyme
MTARKLTAFEKAVVGNLASKAALAASLLDAWAEYPADSVQTVRSLIDHAQLGVTEEAATGQILEAAVSLGLADRVPFGYVARSTCHLRFHRLAFALNTIEYYVREVHQDLTTARIVLTKPPRPSALERKLSDLGWRTADLELTNHAFNGMVRSAKNQVVVMTPFFDRIGAVWLRELFSHVAPGVERVLILRSLEDPSRNDYPEGYAAISCWLTANSVQVFNYSIQRVEAYGRETFHAKVILCDRNSAYLGSTNITAASLEHSLEMGVVLQGNAAAEIAEVVHAVMAAATSYS